MMNDTEKLALLTNREFSIVRAMGTGKRIAQLAHQLQLSTTAISYNLASARNKLGMTPRELRAWARNMFTWKRSTIPLALAPSDSQ
jgi:DNA-binding NarL/FixJ family response regulator